MRQVEFQGHARAMPFDPIRVSNANVEQIARQGAQTLKYMEMAARQDIDNRRTQLEAMTRNSEFERQQRNTNEQLSRDNARAAQNARGRNLEIRQQNTQQRLSDSQQYLESQRIKSELERQNAETVFSSLSQFSATASKLVKQYSDQKYETDLNDEYTKTMMYGLPTEQSIQQAEGEHALAIQGEHYDLKIDMLEAKGADPHSVAYLRSLNPARRAGREKAMAQMMSQNYGSWLDRQFETNKEFKLVLPGPEGNRELTPSEATTSAEKAAFMTALMPDYLKQNGLHGRSSAFLAEALLNMRRAQDNILARTRQAEAKEYNQQLVDTARDSAFDNPGDPVTSMQYFRTLARSKDANGNPIGLAGARKVWLQEIFTATDGEGNFRYQQEDIDKILAQPFDGPDRTPIGDRYSPEIAELKRERSNLQNKLYQEQETTQAREFGELNDLTREWLNNNWDGSSEALDPLVEKFTREGNGEGLKMLQTYQTDLSNEGRNDKMYEEIWADKLAVGVLTQEEVKKANVSSKLKLSWMQRAQQSEQSAMPAEMRKAAEEYLKSSLAGRLGEVSTSTIKDPTYHRAVYAATRKYMSDYMFAMQKPGATPDQADAYALGIFQKEFQQESGKYGITKLNGDRYKPYFSRFTVAPKSQATHPLTFAREQIKADPNALQTKPLLDEGELRRISAAVKSGRSFTIPKSAQYLANMLGGVSASDVLNAQMKFYGIDQIPIKAYEQSIAAVDPLYQRLLTYTPNRTRAEIAAVGSGISGAVAAKRVQGKVNTPAEILSTYLAAGGDQKRAVLMTAIAMAESSGRQDAARSDTDVHGWFQVRYPVHVDKLRALGITSRAQLLDPTNNTKAAIAILNSQGLGAWEAYTNGAYKRFLPAAEAAMKSYGQGPWRQGPNMNFNVVQYLTGDTKYRHPTNGNQFYYAPDHGGSNYHEHVGFRTRQDRDQAVAMLKREGIKIGSMNDGVHADGSLHYEDRAVDLPMPHHIPPGSREERAYSARIRRLLGIPG